MNKFFLLIIILLTSCSSNIERYDFKMSNDMSFDEFKLKLNQYATINPYPNIDD